MESKYGVDVARTRADDLDKILLAEVSESTNCTVLDIGSGAGGQAKRMVQAGAKVLAIDVVDYGSEFAQILDDNNFEPGQLQFVCTDVASWLSKTEQKFDFVCMQRVIHYFSYQDALELLSELKRFVNKKLYISASGLESAIGCYYADAKKDVVDRYCRLDKEGVEKFFIAEPVCLYTQDEFVRLLQESGWQVEKVWTSAFGNVKAICC